MADVKNTVSWDPTTGIYCNLINHEDGSITIENKQIIDPIIETNKRLQNEYNPSSDFGRRVASIPLIVLEMLKQQGILNEKLQPVDSKKFKAWLNNSENRFFRVNGEHI